MIWYLTGTMLTTQTYTKGMSMSLCLWEESDNMVLFPCYGPVKGVSGAGGPIPKYGTSKQVIIKLFSSGAYDLSE